MPDQIHEELPALLPYMRYHESRTGQTFFRVEVSTRMRRAGFPVPYLSLGTDLERALAIYNERVAPLLEAWTEKGAAIEVDNDSSTYGSLEWWHAQYKNTERYRALAGTTKADYDARIRRCCSHLVKSGRFAGQRFGSIPTKWITEADADDFYAEYVVKLKTDEEGNVVEERRQRTAKLDLEALRAMVNALRRKYRHLLHEKTNPFAGMFMPYRGKSPIPAIHPWLARFVRTSDAKGLMSVSAIVVFLWELKARPTHTPYKMKVTDFRGPNHEDQVYVVSDKTHQCGWFWLENDDGQPLYPALTQRLAALKGKRSTGPMFLCERAEKPRPWKPAELRAVVAEICHEAGLPHLTLSQFRKGGLAEAGEAGLSEWQIVSQSLHLEPGRVLKHYLQRNAETAMGGQELTLKYRAKKAKRGIDIVT
jgi:hypothetical protein